MILFYFESSIKGECAYGVVVKQALFGVWCLAVFLLGPGTGNIVILEWKYSKREKNRNLKSSKRMKQGKHVKMQG